MGGSIVFWSGTRKFLFICLVGLVTIIYQACSPFSALDEGNDGFASGSLKCDPNDPREPKPSKIKRLAKHEIKYTLTDLFSPYLSKTELETLQSNLESALNEIPKDHVDGNLDLDISDRSVNQDHVDALIKIAQITAEYFVNDSDRFQSLLGDCYNNREQENCKSQFIREFGLRVHRSPVTDDKLANYLSLIDGPQGSYKMLIASMLSSPEFFYHLEFGETESAHSDGESTLYELSSYETANRLSYFLLQSMPDEELFAVATSGAIKTAQGMQAQVTRLMKDPRVRRRLTRAFVDQWLHLDEEIQLRTEIQAVQTMVSELETQASGKERIENMNEEVYQYFDYMIWEQQANFKELMTSSLVFPKTPDLAEIVGTDVWNGNYELGQLVRAPASERAGVFTRPRFLFTGGESTRPILRGVEVYRNFLCRSLELPPDNSNPEGVVLRDDMSEKEHIQEITEMEGTTCVGCHQKIINPIGFSFESFDSFGRFRESERIFHPEDSAEAGQVLVSKPVESHSSIQLPGLIEAEIDNAVDLAFEVARSPDANSCFSYKLWNFARKDILDFRTSACAVLSLHERAASSDGSIIEILSNIPLQPEFTRRATQ